MIDFVKVRDVAPIDAVARGYLGLDMEGDDVLRGSCPRCNGERDLSIRWTKDGSKQYFTCHTSKAWGDAIDLVVHCHDITRTEAAEALSKIYLNPDYQPKKPKQEKKEETGFTPLTYLDPEHPLVEELGFKDIAQQAGIGYAGKGLMRTHVAIPVRLPDGTLVGYVGVKGPVKVPKSWRVG
jgi:hypothetical protein